ncbi:CsgG/HfaB family protein [Thermodesulfatator autotrophicus]|uniref:CsgG/HfaB family protein n=1 Tax=Thermodesulfatator autotrophicus TaxID=1795632 RepID=UPI0009ED8407
MKSLLCFFIWLFLLASPALAEQIKIAILPFKINAKEDLSYVREGIEDMLSTRLYDPGKVVVLDKSEVEKVLKNQKKPLNTDVAKKIGEMLGADYVVLGSITSFGQKVSIDAKLIPVKEEKSPLAIYTYTNSLDEIIPKLDEFAQKGLAFVEGKPFTSDIKLARPSKPASLTPSTGMAGNVFPAVTPSRPSLQAGAGQVGAVYQPVSPPAQPQFPQEPSKMHPERVFRNNSQQMVNPAAAPPQQPPSPPSQVYASTPNKYYDVDSWPDYRPEAVTPPVVQSPPQEEKKKKGFWSKLLPWNWFGKKDEEEVVITPKGSVPLPPPPPQSPVPQNNQPSIEAQVPPPSSSSDQGKTWEWY